MFRTIEIEGEPCTVWAVCPCERGTTIRVSAYHPLQDVQDWLLEDVDMASVAAMANDQPDPVRWLLALGGVSDRLSRVATEARYLYGIATGRSYHERPRASLPSDPTEPPF